MKKVYSLLLGTIASLALLVANTGAGTTCYGFLGQPEFPSKLHK